MQPYSNFTKITTCNCTVFIRRVLIMQRSW